MSAAQLAACCLELLAPAAADALAVVGPRSGALAAALAARVPLVGPSESASAAIVTFLSAALSPSERQRQLVAVKTCLRPGGMLLLVDYNQPRRFGPRLVAWVLLALRGLAPSRARYPAARELQTLGFMVERMRLAAAERVQLVLARAS